MRPVQTESFDQVVRDAHVMMIDDEQLNMDVLQIHLEAEGYTRFTSLADSRQALDRLDAERPDVLLLDLMMPHVSGLEILKLMSERGALSGIPVLVLTSSDDATMKLEALQLGATDFLSKPVDASELALRMRNTLKARAWQQRRARMDSLTELPNRICFTQLIERELNRAGDGTSPGVCSVVNIKRFKAINDSLGTERGDEVLWLLREKLLGTFGRNPPDIIDALSFGARRDGGSCVARLGADRFAVYTPGDERIPRTVELIERFLASLEVPMLIGGEKIFVGASIGIARLVTDGLRVSDVLNAAESALAIAGEDGDLDYAHYSAEMDCKARERLSLENGLRTAVEDGGIFLTYQPKLDVQSNRILGAEALVRWQHPELGLISPADFIPLAEHSGSIVSIGEWVLREACRQARRWQETHQSDFKIAVNVSIRQLREPAFVDCVQRALEDSGLDAASLMLELTENMIVENANSSIDRLDKLRALGVGISIDDFGTGYSSLAYLQRLPIDQLKIDQSFIREITGPADKVPIVKAVISLAHDLGLHVVAEGVETHHQLARMRALRCEEYQGYLASRPVVADEFEALLGGKLAVSA